MPESPLSQLWLPIISHCPSTPCLSPTPFQLNINESFHSETEGKQQSMLPKTVINMSKRSKLVQENKSRKLSAKFVFHVSVWLMCKWQKNKGKGGEWYLQSQTGLIINFYMKFCEYLCLFLHLVGKWSQMSNNKCSNEPGLHSETENVAKWQTALSAEVKATGTSHGCGINSAKSSSDILTCN